MTAASLSKVVAYVRRVGEHSTAGEMPDGQLLEQFLRQQDAAAFEALIQRHAGMVLGVCTRVLRQRQDAEDAMQATFMVLIRQGSSMTRQGNFAGWLYGVALRTALYVRRRAARRRLVESRLDPRRTVGEPSLDTVWTDLRLVLDDELSRLPAKYRDPIVLCYLEGRTNEQAARALGWTKGTVSGRLARARDLLRIRLTQRGLALSGVVLTSALSERGASAAAVSLIQATVKAGAGVVAGTAASSAPVALIAQEVLRTMAISKLKSTLIISGALGLLLAGSGYYGRAMFNLLEPGQPPAKQKQDLPMDDQERILGTWVVVEAEHDGQDLAALHGGRRLHIKFTREQMQFLNMGIDNPMTYRLLPNKSPKMLETEGTLAGVKHKNIGIYAFDGDKLKLCLNNGGEQVPKDFTAPKGAPFSSFVLRSLKGKEAPAIEENPQVKEAMARMISANNLKQILLAFHNFQAANGRLPGVAITSTDGTPLLSWRVALLPYLEQLELYNQFRLNEAWNSRHNRALISKMPKFFARPGEAPKAPFKTQYRAFVGPDAFFSGHGGRKMPEDFPKGVSNTLAIFEAAEGVVWTQPEEIPYSVERPLPAFGNWFGNGFHLTLADASVRIQAHKPDETIMRDLISVTGGAVVPIPNANGAGLKK